MDGRKGNEMAEEKGGWMVYNGLRLRLGEEKEEEEEENYV